MNTYIILIFLFIMFLIVLQVINFAIQIFIILLLKDFMKSRDVKSDKTLDKTKKEVGFGK